MGTEYNLFKRFVVALAISLSVVGGASLWIVSTAMERNMVERAKELTAEVVKEEIREELGDVDLTAPLEGPALERIDEKADHLNLGPEVRHVKIWNREMSVVWSERREFVGESFPDNEELAEALEGRIVSEMSEGGKYDWEQELPVSFLEVYIPVRFDDEGQVLTVAEIYQDLTPLYADIARHRNTVLAVTSSGFVALFLVLSGIVWRGSRKIDDQARKLRQSYDEISEARDEWEATFDTISEAITVHDRDFNIIQANREAKELLGISGREGLKCYQYYHGTDAPPDNCDSCKVYDDGVAVKVTTYEPHLGRHLEINTFPRRGADDKIVGLVHVVRDVTDEKEMTEEREKLKLQLMQSQKMETVGRMAGSIAHDFNNLLTVIMGCSDLLLAALPADDPRRRHVETILTAGEKGGGLTRQLLAFSRQQVLEMKRIDLNTVIEQMSMLLKRTIGEDITFDIRTSATPCSALADRVQIEQVLLNLAVNARDAMPRGGRLLVETEHKELDSEFLAGVSGSGREGRYVMLAVTDTGTGVPRDVQEHIFEPFFSTKEQGKGTGLGLATVFGIVKQHEGFITLYSEPGHGSTFKVFLPAVAGVSDDDKVEVRDHALRGGTERILLVEDDATIRKLLSSTLSAAGYGVSAAGSGDAALAVMDREGDFDLLLSDVILPGMSGIELARAVRERMPEIKVIFMSGYTDAAVSRYGKLDEGCVLLQKPLTPRLLLDRIAEILKA